MLAIYTLLMSVGLLTLVGAVMIYAVSAMAALSGLTDATRTAQWFALATSGVLVALVAFVGALASRPR